jgi:DNA-binding transcriptional regulator YdaS (Cro superfamily)
MSAIQRAIEVAGGLSALAKALNVKPQVVYNWRDRNRVPAERCGDIERATDGRITSHDLRPDVFRPPAKRAERRAAS